eukprot:CAMPEP_0194028564 /NCGR_PEP_ID=MMETSP0009_2-20130614/2500_1 /TAXON_ID=210454 /ORGANISM="Grammatophora oceanica, Strain CCMP 410" /LENGTH=138 /DNA_ID=CAMNT_0038667991 /DNA_START=105 /DNA_END=521 /DNA_ORIENTATION=+
MSRVKTAAATTIQVRFRSHRCQKFLQVRNKDAKEMEDRKERETDAIKRQKIAELWFFRIFVAVMVLFAMVSLRTVANRDTRAFADHKRAIVKPIRSTVAEANSSSKIFIGPISKKKGSPIKEIQQKIGKIFNPGHSSM